MLLLASSCGSNRADEGEWGEEAIRYFEGLSAALSTDDFYGALDFFAPEAEVQSRTSDFQDASVPVSQYLESHRADLSQELLDVHLGRAEAATLIQWSGSGRFGAVLTEFDVGSIVRETEFVDVNSLERSLLASPEIVEMYEGVYRDYAEAWSEADATRLGALYAEDVSIRHMITDLESRGHSGVTELASKGVRRVAPLSTADIAGAAADGGTGVALYLDPVSFGHDPGRAIAVYSVELADCRVQSLVALEVAAGRITSEQRYPDVESYRSCAGELPTGWWTGLELPGPRDEIVTSVIDAAGESTITVHNGTNKLEDLVRWGLERFTASGLTEPRLDSVTFEPSRRCEGIGGQVATGETSHDLVLCIYESDMCSGTGDCEVPLLAVRSSLLHEMGHAWLRDHVDAAARPRLLEVSNRAVWSDSDIPWADRGVEYFAEVLAWGLVDEPINLEQLGSPPCPELRAAFGVLTGASPGPSAVACLEE